jgi:hypothetical protein
MPHFTTPTATGYAVARLSYALGGAMAVLECATQEEAEKCCARLNLETAQAAAALVREDRARMERRSMRSCLPGLCA